MKIFLSGYMGSGKTVIGALLSKSLIMPFLDLDLEIEKREKLAVREIFEKRGEIYFRQVEAKVLEHSVSSDSDFIMALGGGTPCYGKNLQLLKRDQELKIIFLKASPTELTNRLLGQNEQRRPLISHLSSAEALEDYIRKHLFERNFYYNQADLIIPTDHKTPDEVAQEIVQQLN